MTQHNEQITPTRFEAAPEPETAAPAAATATGERPRWLLPALGGLVLLALLVVFWLPGTVSPPNTAAPAAADRAAASAGAAAPGATTPGTPRPRAAPEEASPWNDAQLARLRKAAQDVLAELLEIQFDLEERGVERWAAEDYAAARALAQAGDAHYKSREFEAARASYEQALAAMEALQVALPEAVTAELSRVDEALEALDEASAAASLDLLTTMEPENAALAALKGRLDTLPQLAAQLELATRAEAAGDLGEAEKALNRAVALDPQHRRSAGELARVQAAYLDQRFNQAMSRGYQALDEGQLRAARESFREAAALVPGSDEAASALQEVAAAETGASLASLKRSGRALEEKEQWQQAVAAYEKALKLDANLSFARQGLERAQARARLDKQFRAVLEQPERLSDLAVARDSEQLLQRAAAVTPRGPLLERQIAQLQTLLDKANSPIRVVLRSDMETEVIVYKVARLGRFEQKELELRPGTYVAVGTRIGFRDVRRSFTVNHDQAVEPVVIRCTEPI